jgi:hypothetical protein
MFKFKNLLNLIIQIFLLMSLGSNNVFSLAPNSELDKNQRKSKNIFLEWQEDLREEDMRTPRLEQSDNLEMSTPEVKRVLVSSFFRVKGGEMGVRRVLELTEPQLEQSEEPEIGIQRDTRVIRSKNLDRSTPLVKEILKKSSEGFRSVKFREKKDLLKKFLSKLDRREERLRFNFEKLDSDLINKLEIKEIGRGKARIAYKFIFDSKEFVIKVPLLGGEAETYIERRIFKELQHLDCVSNLLEIEGVKSSCLIVEYIGGFELSFIDKYEEALLKEDISILGSGDSFNAFYRYVETFKDDNREKKVREIKKRLTEEYYFSIGKLLGGSARKGEFGELKVICDTDLHWDNVKYDSNIEGVVIIDLGGAEEYSFLDAVEEIIEEKGKIEQINRFFVMVGEKIWIEEEREGFFSTFLFGIMEGFLVNKNLTKEARNKIKKQLDEKFGMLDSLEEVEGIFEGIFSIVWKDLKIEEESQMQTINNILNLSLRVCSEA